MNTRDRIDCASSHAHDHRPRNLDHCPGSGRPTDGASPCPVCGARFYLERPGVPQSGVIHDHARRYEPSATYYPRTADYRNDPWLSGMAKMGCSEEQVIDVLAQRCRELTAQMVRYVELHGTPDIRALTADMRAEYDATIRRARER